MRDCRRAWDESRGDEFNDWGTASYWFETANDGGVHRQIEVYASGVVLAYDEAHRTDRYGGLAEGPLDLVDFAAYEVSAEEFEWAWRPASAFNRRALSGDES